MKIQAPGIVLLATLAWIPAFAVRAQSPVPATGASTQQPAATMGRLFYTPAQRAALDDMRKRPQTVIAAEQTSSLPPAPEYVTLNGIVRRSDGATTVWLNDRQVQGRESEEGLRITPPRRSSTPSHVTVVVPQTGHTVDLKVGQQLEVNSGAVKERYRSPTRPHAVAEAAPAKAPPAEPAPRERRSVRELETLRDLLDGLDRPAGASSPSSDGKGSIAQKP